MEELMAKYEVTTPDSDYTWNILILDVLGTSMFKEEVEEYNELEDEDLDIWDDEDLD